MLNLFFILRPILMMILGGVSGLPDCMHLGILQFMSFSEKCGKNTLLTRGGKNGQKSEISKEKWGSQKKLFDDSVGIEQKSDVLMGQFCFCVMFLLNLIVEQINELLLY